MKHTSTFFAVLLLAPLQFVRGIKPTCRVTGRLHVWLCLCCLILTIKPQAQAQSTNWLNGTFALNSIYGQSTDTDFVDNATLNVTSGGSLTAGQLDVGPTNAATLTLMPNASIAVQTLLATNVVGVIANSVFNFSGGTLVTSNGTGDGFAAKILLANNISFDINGNWTMNSGTNLISYVATNINPPAYIYVGDEINNVQVNVNPNAVWWTAIPTNSPAANTLAVVIGNGNATSNQFVVNGGTVIATNYSGSTAAFNVGNGVGPAGNQLIITNGGQIITKNGQNGIYSCNISSGINNGVYVAGTNAAGRKATWTFLGGERFNIGGAATYNSWLAVNSGGVISNALIFVYDSYSYMYVTNGGLVYPSSGLIVGRNGLNDLLVVAGVDAAGNQATVSFITNKNSYLTVGGGTQTPSSPSPGTNNVARVDAGGLLTNCYTVYVGEDTNSVGNTLIITNGGQVYGLGGNGGGGYIGYVAGCNNNSISIGGGTGVSLWNLGGHPLTIGNTLGGSAAGTNNFVTLFSGGVLTNVTTIVLSGSGSLLRFNGGTLAAGTSGYLITNATGAVNYTNYVQAGGAIINDSGLTVTNLLPMLQDPNSTGGGLSKLGSGTLALLGGNTYTGPTLVSDGTLALFGVNTYTGPTVISAGTLVIGGTGLLGNGTYAANLTNNGVFTYASTAAQTLSGVISGTGSTIISSGTLTLTGVNTYSGPTVISAGTLLIGGMGLLGNGNYAANLVNNGVFTYTSTAAQTLSGVISGTGSTIINSGTLLLNGDASAATNTLTVNGGFFGGNGTNGGNVIMNAGSGLVPGGIGIVGTLTLTNNLTLNGNNLFFNFATNMPTTNDLVVVGNTLYLTNANSVTLSVAGRIPAGNYTLMTFANGYAGTGTFALTGLTNKATLVMNANSLVLQVGANGIYPDIWKGYVNGTWDTSVLNWTNSGTATNFNTGDDVLFDDTLVRNSTISNTSPGVMVSPNSVTFNNNLTNYTIKANITGTAWLTLSGSATVTLTGSNTYTGNTTINAGTLTVTNGGAINSPAATLNIGTQAGVAGTGTLLAGGSIIVQTLLATNNNYAVTNSTFNFNGGTLVTSNYNGLAATILVASNTAYAINGNWTMNAGINLITTPPGVSNMVGALLDVVKIGTAATNSGLLVMVNSNAIWSLGSQPSYAAYGAPTNNLDINLSSTGTGTTNNQLVVNGGVVTNVFTVTVGSAANCAGNQVIVTNGGAFYLGGTNNSGGNLGFILGNAAAANSNSVVVMGTNSSGSKATMDLGSTRIEIGGNQAAGYNSVMVGSGGVISNATLLMINGFNSSFIITNGGVFNNSAQSAMVGRSVATNNLVIVAGADSGGNSSTFNGGNQTVLISAFASATPSSNGTNNGVWIAAGGLLTNATAIYIGGLAANETNDMGNYLIITNGGRCYSAASSIGGGTNDNGNWAYVGGAFGSTNALWNLGNHSLTIGANALASNNYATLFGGGLLTNVASVILGGENSLLKFNGGTLAASGNGNLIATNSTTVNATNYVQTGGAIINDNGFAVTLQLPLLQDPKSIGGGLTKFGSGTLMLSNVNTYTGPTFVNAGTLALGGSASIANSTNITVAGGATLNVSALSSPFTLRASQTLSNSAVGSIINGTNNCSVGTLSLVYDGTNVSFIVANGGITLSASTMIKLNCTGPALTRGSYRIIAQGSEGIVAGEVPTNVVYTGSSLAGAPLLQFLPGGLYLSIGGQASEIIYGSTTFFYDGSAQSPNITFIGSTGARTTNYVGVSVSYGPSPNPPTNAGVYYETNTVAADANFFSATNSTSFTINPLTLATADAPPKVLFITNGTIGLNFAGIPGNEYVIERSTNLENWTMLLITNLPNNGLISFLDNLIDRGGIQPGSAFYRLMPYNTFNVRDYGAQGDGVALDTSAIQDAINAASAAGGGTVYLPAGTYRTVELFLQNNVTLNIAGGATVAASTNSSDWSLCNHAPVIYALSMTNIGICGSGTIDGGSQTFVDSSGNLVRNSCPDGIIVIGNCRNVNISGVLLQNSDKWTQDYIQCDYLTVNGVSVRNPEAAISQNTDGIDFSGRYITLENLDIETGDDAICLKPQGDPYQSPGRPTHDVTVKYCTVATTCNATKIGTTTSDLAYNVLFDHITVHKHSKITMANNPVPSGSCIAAISLQCNDGGTNHDFIFQNYIITNCDTPIFIETQNRQTYVAHTNTSQLYNATISDIYCSASARASQINVEPGCILQHILFRNLIIHNQETNYATASPPYLNGGYPDAFNYGRMPAYGLFARYVTDLTFTGTNIFYDDGNSGRPVTQYENMGVVTTVPPILPLFNDYFESGATTNWTVLGGTWAVVKDGGYCYQQNNGTVSSAIAVAGNANWTNYSVQAKIKLLSGTNASLIFRYIDSSNKYVIALSPGSPGMIRLQKQIGGTWTDMAAAPYTITTGYLYTVTGVANGSNLWVYINGDLLMTAADASLTSGQVALATSIASAEFDDVAVYPLFTDSFQTGSASQWTPAGGSWYVVADGGEVYQQTNASGSTYSYAGNTNWCNYSLEAAVKVLSGATATVNFRYIDPNNYYAVELSPGSPGTIALNKKFAGINTTLQTLSYPMKTGVQYTVDVTAEGPFLCVYINGVLELFVIDSSIINGQIALGTYNAAAEFDNVVVSQQ